MRHLPLSARFREFFKAVFPALILVVMSLAVSASAQSTFGSILGSVTDSSGAVVHARTCIHGNVAVASTPIQAAKRMSTWQAGGCSKEKRRLHFSRSRRMQQMLHG